MGLFLAYFNIPDPNILKDWIFIQSDITDTLYLLHEIQGNVVIWEKEMKAQMTYAAKKKFLRKWHCKSH